MTNITFKWSAPEDSSLVCRVLSRKGRILTRLSLDDWRQLQLIQVLDWYEHQELGRTKLTMICGMAYLGASTVERLQQCYPERQTVSQAQRELARAAWAAFRSPDPTQWTRLLRQDMSSLQ